MFCFAAQDHLKKEVLNVYAAPSLCAHCIRLVPWRKCFSSSSLNPQLQIQLSRKFKQRFNHSLSACEIRKSKIRKAGRGVFLQESALSGQILFKYGGLRISLAEADRLAELVSQHISPQFRILDRLGLMVSNFLWISCRGWILTSNRTYYMHFATTQGQHLSIL